MDIFETVFEEVREHLDMELHGDYRKPKSYEPLRENQLREDILRDQILLHFGGVALQVLVEKEIQLDHYLPEVSRIQRFSVDRLEKPLDDVVGVIRIAVEQHRSRDKVEALDVADTSDICDADEDVLEGVLASRSVRIEVIEA